MFEGLLWLSSTTRLNRVASSERCCCEIVSADSARKLKFGSRFKSGDLLWLP